MLFVHLLRPQANGHGYQYRHRQGNYYGVHHWPGHLCDQDVSTKEHLTDPQWYCLRFVNEQIQEDGHESAGYKACHGSGPGGSSPVEGGGVHGKEGGGT